MPSPGTVFLLKRRRQFGLAFALAHTIHLLAILAYFRVMNMVFLTAENIPAISIYVFMGLMVLTSNNYAQRRLKTGWKVLHKIGIYGLFVGFFTTYLGRVQEHSESFPIDHLHYESIASYWVLLILVSLAWLTRIIVFWKTR